MKQNRAQYAKARDRKRDAQLELGAMQRRQSGQNRSNGMLLADDEYHRVHGLLRSIVAAADAEMARLDAEFRELYKNQPPVPREYDIRGGVRERHGKTDLEP